MQRGAIQVETLATCLIGHLESAIAHIGSWQQTHPATIIEMVADPVAAIFKPVLSVLATRRTLMHDSMLDLLVAPIGLDIVHPNHTSRIQTPMTGWTLEKKMPGGDAGHNGTQIDFRVFRPSCARSSRDLEVIFCQGFRLNLACVVSQMEGLPLCKHIKTSPT